MEKALARLREAAPQAKLSGIAADLGNAEGADALIAALPTVDILVNNAGIYGLADFFEADDDCWDDYWQTNVMSGVRLSRALVPAMVKRGLGQGGVYLL